MFFLKPLIFVLFSLPLLAEAKDVKICDMLDLPNCEGVTRQGRRTSMQSYPSPSTSAIINPATVNVDRGFGVEAIAQGGNPVNFSLAGGSGKFGGALISTSIENSFFGNRVVELDGVYGERVENKKQYRPKKLALAGGLKLMRKNKYGVDLGFLIKRHPEIKKINPGIGLSARIGFLTLGGSVYQDDFILFAKDAARVPTGGIYDTVFTGPTYTEKFTVQTLSGGIRIENLAVDVGLIKTKYKFYTEDSTTRIISSSYFWKNFMFNLASRTEESPAPFVEDGQLVFKKKKTSMFYGIQGSIGKHFIIGVNYNYFLLDEYSLIGSLFF